MIHRKLQFKSMLLCCESCGQIAHFSKDFGTKAMRPATRNRKSLFTCKASAKSAVNWRAPVHLKSITQPLVLQMGFGCSSSPQSCVEAADRIICTRVGGRSEGARVDIYTFIRRRTKEGHEKGGVRRIAQPQLESIIHPCCSWSGPAASKLQHTHTSGRASQNRERFK